MVAIIVSMIGLASQSAYPRVYVIGRKRGEDVLRPLSPEHGDDETFEGLLILRPEGRLFFVNAEGVGQQIQALVARYQPRVLLLDMSRVSDIEYSARQMLNEGERRITDGVEVWLAGLNPGVLATMKDGLHRGLVASACCSTRAAIERAPWARRVTGGARPRALRQRARIAASRLHPLTQASTESAPAQPRRTRSATSS